jgi:hypothetical protein
MDRYVRTRCETLEDSLQASLARCARLRHGRKHAAGLEDHKCRKYMPEGSS